MKDTHVLVVRWTEPERGSTSYTGFLSPAEVEKVRGVIGWLKDNAGQDWGGSLPSFELLRSDEDRGESLDEEGILGMIHTDSRYCETEEPGEYYGGRNEVLDSLAP